MNDPGSETSSAGGQSHPKTATSLKCRGDTSREAAQGRGLTAAPAQASMQKTPWDVQGQGRGGSACREDVGQDCSCHPTMGSQPAPAPHLEKRRANNVDCKKGVEKSCSMVDVR